MCLAIPALIKLIEDKEADVEIGGITRRTSLWLTPEAKKDQWFTRPLTTAIMNIYYDHNGK